MYKRFSERLKGSIQSAYEEARRHGYDYVSSTHILLAMIDIECLATKILRRLNVDLETLRGELMQSATPDLESFDPVLDVASKYADERNDYYIGTEHVLYALSTIPEISTYKILHEHALPKNIGKEIFWKDFTLPVTNTLAVRRALRMLPRGLT